jgi:hypothetical protein
MRKLSGPQKGRRKKRDSFVEKKTLGSHHYKFSPIFFSTLYKMWFLSLLLSPPSHTHKVMEPKDTNFLLVHHTQKLWTKCTTDLPTTKGRFIEQENWSVYLPDKGQKD